MTIQRGSECWFLAQSKPNSTQIAVRNLKRQGFQTFLPVEESSKRVRDRFVTAERPLFPGYIFVASSPDLGFWRAINSTSGITRLVSFGGEPTPVPFTIVTALMERCDASGKLLTPKHLKPGDEVRLISGPLSDFVGTIESIAGERRIWLLMEFMGGQTRVAVEEDRLLHAQYPQNS